MYKRLSFILPPFVMTMVLLGSLSLLTLYYEKLLIDSTNDRLKQVANVAAMVFRNEANHDVETITHAEDALMDALLDDDEAEAEDIEHDDYLHGKSPHQEDTINFDKMMDQIANTTQTRLTLMDPGGEILGDSTLTELDLLSVDNHADRPEFIDAMATGFGKNEHYSKTARTNMLFIAVKAYITDHEGFTSPYIIRAALPRTTIANQMLQIWMWVALISMAGTACVIAITLLFNRMMRKQAQREKDVLKSEVMVRTRELSLMQQLGSLMSACTTMSSAAQVVHPVAAKLLPGSHSGAISLIKTSRNRLDILTNWGEKWKGAERFEPSECWALLKGHAHYSEDDDLEIRCGHNHDDQDIQVCIPLVAQGETLGILHLCYPDRETLESTNAMAESMAEQIGLALANMRLREDLRQQAIRDPLTGMFNRRHMMDFMEQQMFRTDQRHKPLSVLMIDLDHFKRFNDTFGHDAGDYVLKQVAIELRGSVGTDDLVCRYGGEEIAIICPDKDLESGQQLAQDLVRRVANQGMQFNGQSLGNITMSIGVTSRRNYEISIEAILKEADDALYEAKEAGRNQAVVHNHNRTLPSNDNVTSFDVEKPSDLEAG